MEKELKGFRKIIDRFPRSSSVLDVGAWGLEGDNTTITLMEEFDDVTLINRRALEEDGMIVADYYKHDFKDKRFDLIVLDLNIDNNILMDWYHDFIHSKRWLKPDGKIICYAMTISDYGDIDTPKMIRGWWKNFWETEQLTKEIIQKKYDVVETDEKRPEIEWVLI